MSLAATPLEFSSAKLAGNVINTNQIPGGVGKIRWVAHDGFNDFSPLRMTDECRGPCTHVEIKVFIWAWQSLLLRLFICDVDSKGLLGLK